MKNESMARESERRSISVKGAKDLPSGLPCKLIFLIENRMLREAMTELFQRQPEFSVAGSIRYSETAYKQAAALDWNLLLIDQPSAAALPQNFIADLLSLSRGRKAILFGMEHDPEIFLEGVRCGVSGYLLGDASAKDIMEAVRKVTAGEAVCPPVLCHDLFQFVARSPRNSSMIPNQRLCLKLGLTPRQQQLVALIARGLTNKEIAASLHLSEFTVKNHVHRIMRQLKAQSRHAAVQTVCEHSFAATI
jgi:DNA-binding NarL/FixJ family response regulator